MQQRTRRPSWLLGLVILAYTCFATGALSWLPALLYSSQHHHDVLVQYQDRTVTWSMFHHEEAADHLHAHVVLADAVGDQPDHQFSTPDTQDTEFTSKPMFMALIPVVMALLILAAFLALLRHQQFKLSPPRFFTASLRLWIHNLRRTAVLRH